MRTAFEIQEDAYAAFDAWLASQGDDVQELSLLDQIEVYAKSNG